MGFLKNIKILISIILIISSSMSYSQQVTVTSSLDSDYLLIYQTLAKKLYNKFPYLFYKSCESGRVDTHQCGEIPFGDLVQDEFSAKRKIAFNVKVPGQSFDKNGYKGTFPESEFPVYISRKQFAGAPISERLINKPNEEQTVSSYFGKDLYMRMFSENNQMFGTACFYSPGATIESPLKIISFTAKKHVMWPFNSLKSDIKTKIQITPYRFQAMKSCFSFRVRANFSNRLITYEPELIAILKPVIIGLTPGEIKVSVDVSGGNFLGTLANSYIEGPVSKAIEDSIRSKMGDKINDFITKDLKNGEWVKKFIDSSYHQYLTNNIAQKLKEALKIEYTPEINIGESMVKQCVNLISSIKVGPTGADTKASLLLNCEDFKNMSFRSFEQDSKSESLGCYTGYTRLTEMDPITKPTIKILNECKFTHTIEIKVVPIFKPLASCLINQWKENFAGSCKDEIAQLQTLLKSTGAL